MGKVCFSDADGGGQFYVLVELEEHVVALDCQFAGGKDHHCSNVSSLVSGSFITRFLCLLPEDCLHQGNQKSTCFARSCH